MKLFKHTNYSCYIVFELLSKLATSLAKIAIMTSEVAMYCKETKKPKRNHYVPAFQSWQDLVFITILL